MIHQAIRPYAYLLRLAVADLFDLLTGRREEMTPARLQNHRIGGSDFRRTGEELVAVIRDGAALQPHERVLDIGCGYGRVAAPLTKYLAGGEYAGFDIDARAIRWCRRAISARYPNFWFTHVDVANSYYNRRGRVAPDAFTFPCAAASIDVAVATSLFTHLLPKPTARYAAEIGRVLKTGGRAVASFFLFDDESRSRLTEPHVRPPFAYFPESFYAVSDVRQPELAVAYDERVVREAFGEQRLEITRIDRGSWTGRPAANYQDFIIAVKR